MSEVILKIDEAILNKTIIPYTVALSRELKNLEEKTMRLDSSNMFKISEIRRLVMLIISCNPNDKVIMQLEKQLNELLTN